MKKIMTAKRAKEILDYYNYRDCGALSINSKKPDVLPPTQEEIATVWYSSTKGSDTLHSLLLKIIKKG